MNNIEYIEVEKLKPFENHPYPSSIPCFMAANLL